MILQENFTLHNGVKIPKIGLGVWQIPNGKTSQAVQDAVKIGYRHIDTAEAYENEDGVGKGVKACGLKREEIFVTSKVAGDCKNYEEAKQLIEGSLKDLGLDHIDLMLIHSPKPWKEFHGDNHYFKENLAVWRALEEAFKAKKLRAIGVSNFQKEDLENIIKNASVKPMVNQVLAHIGNTPFELIRYCQEQDILVEAYSPIAHGEILKNKQVAKIAEKYKVTVPQLCVRYCLQLNLLPLPKTANPDHMKNNAEVDFKISEEDMDHLKKADPIHYGEASRFPVYGGGQ